jgi:hypothetical protein
MHVVQYDDGEVKAERLLGYNARWLLHGSYWFGAGAPALSFQEGSVTWSRRAHGELMDSQAQGLTLYL